jgi:hypothetical protein
MIEVASHPADLGAWDAKVQPFYLELFGETTPVVDTKYAEVLPAGPVDGAVLGVQAAPIYEYWWTIGHSGSAHPTHHLWEVFGPGEPDALWHHLKDPAARVYLFVPTSGGWRIKEVVATVKYLSPVHEQATWWEKAADPLKNLAPVAGALGAAGQLVPNPAVATASGMLSAVAKLQLTSVPQTDGFTWSVGKVTCRSEFGITQGVVWTLPPRMFNDLGGRLTGSLAVSFIPSQMQGEQPATGLPVFQPRPVLAHAVVYGPDGEIWVPGQREFVRLHLAPVSPSA